MEELAKLSPAGQVVAIIGITVVLCFLIYQFYKTIRES